MALEQKISKIPHEDLWREQGNKLPWFKPFSKLLEWQEPVAKWYPDGELNASYACVDVHALGDRKDKVALYWENEQGDARSWTYLELYQEVNRIARILTQFGVRKGDVVVVYMPMVLEAVAAVLAITRLGAAHSVVFSGFSSQALKDRIEDTQAKVIITADIGVRRNKELKLKDIVDEAVDGLDVSTILVLQRAPGSCNMQIGRDYFLHEVALINDVAYVPPVPVESANPLFVLYTSGTTGKPKGLVHSTGGYLAYVRAAFSWTFGLNEQSVYWCTADLGWITGHSCVVYGPLLHGATQLIYEGAPDFPHPGRWWELVEKYKITAFYTSPTALRMFMRYGNEWAERHDLSSLQILGSVGEVINPEVWKWFYNVVGQGNCPIVDTWWQTETGCFMIAPAVQLNRELKLKPGSATLPLPGIEPDVVDATGNSLTVGQKGFLVVKQPWPGMSIGIFGDMPRFKQVYWEKFPHWYYTGDYALRDEEGYFWLLGRADEVLNIAGHRVGTAEIESAVVTLDDVAEAAAVGMHDDVRGEVVVVFVIPRQGLKVSETLKTAVISVIREHIGSFVTPRGVFFVEKLPKTRSGKIMRRLLKAVIEGNQLGDVSTLEDEASMEEVKKSFNELRASIL